jgi:hypothetical protein
VETIYGILSLCGIAVSLISAAAQEMFSALTKEVNRTRET